MGKAAAAGCVLALAPAAGAEEAPEAALSRSTPASICRKPTMAITGTRASISRE
jgi:hypothetical protein